MLCLFCDYLPTLCSLGCHLMFLGMIPVLWWYCPRLVPGRGVSLSATGSLFRCLLHSFVSCILGKTCLSGVSSRWCSVASAVSCRTWCPPSAGCMFVYSPLWGLWINRMIACQRKSLPKLFFLWMCSGGNCVSCKCVAISWIGWPSGVLWGGSPDLWPRSSCCIIRDIFPGVSRVRLPRRYIQKDADTSDEAILTVPWRGLDLFIVPNWFLCTDFSNDDTRIVLSPCGIMSRNFFFLPMCVSNVNHLSQFPYFLVAVSLVIPLVVLRMPIVKISRR